MASYRPGLLVSHAGLADGGTPRTTIVPPPIGPHVNQPQAPLVVRLQQDRQGAGAVEFAMVAFPFLLFLFFLIEIGYDFFAQAALDYGVQTASRQIQVGQAQDAATAAIFTTAYVCPVLSGLLPCSPIKVNVTPVTTDFYTGVSATPPVNAAGQIDTSGFIYCPGRPNQLMLMQAVYTSASLVASVIPGMASRTPDGMAHVTASSIAFANENFTVTSAPPAGC